MKMFTVVALHLVLFILFGVIACCYWGIFIDCNPTSPNHMRYLEGCDFFFLGLFLYPGLFFTGGCFFYQVPRPQKWLPWIGILLLGWEVPIFPVGLLYYLVFPENLRQLVTSGIGCTVAIICCSATVWQAVYLLCRHKNT